MSVDLRTKSMLIRASLVLMDDCLIKLEHSYTQDRVRRYKYDRIESVMIWQRLAWVNLILCAILFALPGFLLLVFGQEGLQYLGIGLLVAGALAVGWYLYARKTTIRLVRAGQTYDFSGVFRPGHVRRFRERLLRGIEAVQGIAEQPAPPPLPGSLPVEGDVRPLPSLSGLKGLASEPATAEPG